MLYVGLSIRLPFVRYTLLDGSSMSSDRSESQATIPVSRRGTCRFWSEHASSCTLFMETNAGHVHGVNGSGSGRMWRLGKHWEAWGRRGLCRPRRKGGSVSPRFELAAAFPRSLHAAYPPHKSHSCEPIIGGNGDECLIRALTSFCPAPAAVPRGRPRPMHCIWRSSD